MSKIICEVCGSSYAETATQCPICGTAKSEAAKPATDAAAEPAKGGKFMRTNKAQKPQAKRDNGKAAGGEDKPSNIVMIVIVAVLLLAIIAVCVFIATRFLGNPNDNTTGGTITTGGNVTTGGDSTTGGNDDPTGGDPEIPCISLSAVENASGTLTFTKAGDSLTMKVSAQPADTTDVITYESTDMAVATVNENGVITAVANGITIVKATCGTQTVSVEVKVEIPVEIKFELDYTDVTLSPRYGETVKLYSGPIDPAEITWTSSSEAVKVENGVVTAVANTGNTPATITATYGDVTKTAKIHVTGMTPYSLTWKNDQGENKIYAQVGEKITFYLIDRATGAVVTGVTWERSADAESYGSITLGEENDKGEVIVTCVSATEGVVPGDCVRVIAKFTVGEETYTNDCYIYIKPAATENT